MNTTSFIARLTHALLSLFSLIMISCSAFGGSGGGVDLELLRLDIADAQDTLIEVGEILEPSKPKLALRMQELSTDLESIDTAVELVLAGTGAEGSVVEKIDAFLTATTSVHWSDDPETNAMVQAGVAFSRGILRSAARRLDQQSGSP